MQNGKLDYDRVIAMDMMGVVGRLGKVLGPKGLMPKKLGTVTPNVEQAVKDAKGGQVEPASRKWASSIPASAR